MGQESQCFTIHSLVYTHGNAMDVVDVLVLAIALITGGILIHGRPYVPQVIRRLEMHKVKGGILPQSDNSGDNSGDNFMGKIRVFAEPGVSYLPRETIEKYGRSTLEKMIGNNGATQIVEIPIDGLWKKEIKCLQRR